METNLKFVLLNTDKIIFDKLDIKEGALLEVSFKDNMVILTVIDDGDLDEDCDDLNEDFEEDIPDMCKCCENFCHHCGRCMIH